MGERPVRVDVRDLLPGDIVCGYPFFGEDPSVGERVTVATSVSLGPVTHQLTFEGDEAPTEFLAPFPDGLAMSTHPVWAILAADDEAARGMPFQPGERYRVHLPGREPYHSVEVISMNTVGDVSVREHFDAASQGTLVRMVPLPAAERMVQLGIWRPEP